MLSAGSGNAEHERQRSHVLQLRYNQNKNALGRAIAGTIETLKSFQEMNLKWPAHYPSVQVAEKQKAQAEANFAEIEYRNTKALAVEVKV